MLLDERLDLAQEIGVAAELELRIDQILVGEQTELFEPRGDEQRERLEGEVGERPSAPKRDRLRRRPAVLSRSGVFRLSSTSRPKRWTSTWSRSRSRR
jgi:hypothetical protein